MRLPLDQPTRTQGFTLLELLIVAVLLAVFAAIIVPSLTGADDEATAATAYSVVRTVGRILERKRDENGDWPANIEAEWFRGHKLPVNPFEPTHRRTIRQNIDPDPTEWHPSQKTTRNHPFWYNPSNGAFRVLVPQQPTDAETVALYNLANGSAISSLSDSEK